MKTLTILTHDYHQILQKDFGLRCIKADNNLYIAKCPKDKFDIENFIKLLEHIVIFNHHIYSQSRKLADMATDVHTAE